VAAPVTLPVGGIIAAGALLTYGGYQAYKFLNKEQINRFPPSSENRNSYI
jgi:hypothetical protein